LAVCVREFLLCKYRVKGEKHVLIEKGTNLIMWNEKENKSTKKRILKTLKFSITRCISLNCRCWIG